jgi:hypothetical protein
MINYFVVCTPFQGYVASMMSQKMDGETIFINSTGKSLLKISSCQLNQEIVLKNRFFDLIQLWMIKKQIARSIREKREIHFFIPHVQTLVSSYFYRLAIKHQNVKLHIYYEGIALLYDPMVKTSKKDIFRRTFLGLVSGFYYTHSNKLYPDQLRNIAIAHSPLPKFTSRFLETKELTFDSKKKNKNKSEHILILGSPIKSEIQLLNQVNKIDRVLDKTESRKILIKSHYSVDPIFSIKVIQHLKNTNKDFEELDPKKSIEELIDSYNIIAIYALHPTSALLNISLIYGDQIKLFSFKDDSSNLWGLNEVFSELKIQFIDS